MIHTYTLKSEDVAKLKTLDVGVAGAVESSMSGPESVGGKMASGYSGSVDVNMAAKKEITNMEKNSKTFTIGGKPPIAGGATVEAFGEWAATVEDFPMPIKYSLRPLSSIGTKTEKILDLETYGIMLELYEKGLLKHRKEKNAEASIVRGSSQLEPGEWLTSGTTTANQLKDHVHKVVFTVGEDGLMTIKDRFNNILWDSGTRTHPHLGPFTLMYQNDGDLVLSYKSGSPLWRSNTKYAACGNRNPSTVKLNKGSLEIHAEGGGAAIWSTLSTKNGGPSKSAAVYQICGDNTCSRQCVKVYKDKGFKGKVATLQAGYYDHSLFAGLGIKNDVISGVEISNGCEVDLYEHDNLDGRKWTYGQSVDFCVGNHESCKDVNDKVSSIGVRSCSLAEMHRYHDTVLPR